MGDDHFDLNYLEMWNIVIGYGKGNSTFELIFKKSIDLRNFYFGVRTNNHMYVKSTDIKITGIHNDENTNVLFNG